MSKFFIRVRTTSLTIIRWFAGFFEDQKGAGSSKRIALYVCLFFIYRMIEQAADGKPINEPILYSILAIILFLVGGITSEFLERWFGDKTNNTTPTVTEDTETTDVR